MNIVTKILISGSILLSAGFSVHSQTNFHAAKGEITATYDERIISGVYPHLTTYAHARENGTYKFGDECGIGAIAVWNGKLYMVNYAAHRPTGSEHKLYIIDKDKKMEIYPGSVGGTPAARMIHKESNQLLIGHYLIDSKGNIRTIPIRNMPGRLTAIARHLTDPANLVYYYDMEGMLYEVNVHTLAVKKLFHNPLPGWHGKGAYTAQGKLFLANNGEHQGFESPKDWKVPVEGQNGPEMFGTLAEFDGQRFQIIERRQFTDVTTQNGIQAIPNEQSPLWAIGWDKRSLRLKVLDKGKWSTFLLPKATYNNDPSHGWFTEWPRIREIGNGKMMMDMHGMFFDFPASFSADNNAGIRPVASHLRYIPDFCGWDGQIVLATDETSIQGNPLSGQPQSNLWFGGMRDIKQWGPASGYGCIWLNDTVKAGQTSLPYLLAGFDNRILHIINHADTPVTLNIQIDKGGNNQWSDYRALTITGNDYHYILLPPKTKGEWIRVVPANDGKLTVALHYTTNRFISGKKFASLFSGLADIEYAQDILGGKLFSNQKNYNLSYFANITCKGKIVESHPFEFGKFSFGFHPDITDSLASKALETKVQYSSEMTFDAKDIDKKQARPLWSVDDASVILHTSKGKLRLPKGNPAFTAQASLFRSVRELESEREIAQIHGTFYELPLSHVGKEPLFEMMRPISSHNKWIEDYNTWNGLLVLSGIKRDAKTSVHIYKNKENTAGIWLGSIDDLWKLGKPVGQGGPWKNTSVRKNQESDPYLMTGYDKKTLALSADRDVQVTLFLSVAHYLEKKVPYITFALKQGETIEYQFPKGFSAHWATMIADKDCKVTAQFLYE